MYIQISQSMLLKRKDTVADKRQQNEFGKFPKQ